MRNSNVMAIAPTATISTIIGVTQSIEPHYKHLFVKSNLSGEFVQVNIHLVKELKRRGLVGRRHAGEDQVPRRIAGRHRGIAGGHSGAVCHGLRNRFPLADRMCQSPPEMDRHGPVAQPVLAQPSGRKLDEMYKLAWQTGLKTTYYLRGLGATQVEKSTVDINKFGMQPKWMKNKSASGDFQVDRQCRSPRPAASTIPDCEACQ